MNIHNISETYQLLNEAHKKLRQCDVKAVPPELISKWADLLNLSTELLNQQYALLQREVKNVSHI